MSKKNMLVFLTLLETDKDFKAKYDGIVQKYEGKDLPEAEKEKLMRKEFVHLAKSNGIEFSLEDFAEMGKPGIEEIPDDELDKATGGKVEFIAENKY